jgi:hypothetical protein
MAVLAVRVRAVEWVTHCGDLVLRGVAVVFQFDEDGGRGQVVAPGELDLDMRATRWSCRPLPRRSHG